MRDEREKVTALARTAPQCLGCARDNDGTVVFAHRNLNGWGIKAGKGLKTAPFLGSWLCHDCHQYGDGEGRRDYQFWELATHRYITYLYENHNLRID
jgi:hypothetical protein